MKIAIDARFYGTENGGLGRYTINLIEQLQRLDTKDEYYLLLRDPWYTRLETTQNFEKVFVSSRHYSLKEQLEIPSIIKKIDPDITHFLHFNVPYFFDRPYVITIHDLLMHKGVGKDATTLPLWKYFLKRLGYRLVFDHAIQSAKHIFTPSEFVKNEIVSFYGRDNTDISVTYEGVVLPSLNEKKSSSPKEKYFLYVGNAYPHKNIKTLLKAIGLINKTSSIPVKLILVIPRDVFTSRLRKEIRALNVDQYVDIQNGVSDVKLRTLYKDSIAFVYPSLLEGFGLPGLEAMYCKTRLIASDIPVFHEIYKDNALYFNPTSAEELSLALLDTINETALQRDAALGKSYVFVKRYSWEKMTRDTLAIYETIKGRDSI